MTLPFAITRPFVLFDLETTSQVRWQARIVEISLVRFEPDGQMTAYSTLINPGVLIPAAATDTHGITNEMVAAAPTWAERGPQVMRAFRSPAGVDLGGYGVAYDLEVLRHENVRHKIDDTVDPALQPKVIDPLRLWQVCEPRSLSDAVKRFCGRAHDGAHRGEADVTATLDVLVGMFGAFMPAAKTLDDLAALTNPQKDDGLVSASSDSKLVTVPGGVAFRFGKWQGRPLSEVDKGYLVWALKQDFSEDAKDLIQAELTSRKQVA